MQRIYPSFHATELFFPLLGHDEIFFHEVVEKGSSIPFYKGIELPLFASRAIRRKTRDLVQEKGLAETVWLSLAMNPAGISLSATDESARKDSVERTLRLIRGCEEMGASRVGLSCGPFLGDRTVKAGTEALYRSFLELSLAIQKDKTGTILIFEPMDRYQYKKNFMGPTDEVVALYTRLWEAGARIYIHWDSAHETLKGENLSESLEKTRPWLSSIHLCDCVTDTKSPLYGDLHMDIGQPPAYRSPGYLTPEIGSAILRQAASYDPPEGIGKTMVSVEVRSHLGDDMWAKEKLTRGYLEKVFALAGIPC